MARHQTFPAVKTLPALLVKDAETKWNAFVRAAGAADIALPDDAELRAALKPIFACSHFIARTLTAAPTLLTELIDTGDIHTTYADDTLDRKIDIALEGIDNEDDLGIALRRFRLREAIRIGLRDLLGSAELVETMRDLSHLAEACIDRAVTFLYRQQLQQETGTEGSAGSTPPMAVIGLGKLGAGELNFSSDVDLVFAYPSSTLTGETAVSGGNEGFFSRLCRRFLHLFRSGSVDGLLFRIDLRLRPFGENGPIVMSFGAMEEYYQSQGRDWERYAWIKARPVAGDRHAGIDLIDRLRPFVYRRYLDYGSFDALRKMKESIALEVKRKGLTANIKLGVGGIREIEFFGQVFQLIRGGVDPELQQPSLLTILQLLAQKRYISPETAQELADAYNFFRHVEHRLQLVDDRQTHDLPADDIGRARIAASAGFSSWNRLSDHLGKLRKQVHGHFKQILASEETGNATEASADKSLEGVWLGLLDPSAAAGVLAATGYENPDDILRLVDFLRNDTETRAISAEGRRRLNRLMPMVLKRVAAKDTTATVLTRLIDLVKSIERRTCYLSLLLENPSALDHLVKLAQASPWIIAFISNHPVLLDELLDTRTLYQPPEKSALRSELARRLAAVPAGDLESQIEALCIFKQLNTLRVAAADISAAYPLMRVSDHLSDIAETVIDAVLNQTWRDLTGKHGLPSGTENAAGAGTPGFAVVAYGKLGGIELGYGSDLDLVFLHSGGPGSTAGGPRPTENSQFFTRLGQRIVHILTTPTRAGTLYEIDMRLRPSGASGPLVSHVKSFGDYQRETAWTWEHQAIVRARVICGDPAVGDHFQTIRRKTLCHPRDTDRLREEIRTMRERMRKTHLNPKEGTFDLKQSPGGIVDIEFLVQYLVLQHASQHPELTDWTDNVRILETLAATGIISPDTAGFLKEAFLYFRSAVHRLNLKQEPTRVAVHSVNRYRQKVEGLWNEMIA